MRVIDAFVDELDLAELGFNGTTLVLTGRPSYHPGVMLKIYIYSSSDNSEQKHKRLYGRDCLPFYGTLQDNAATHPTFAYINDVASPRIYSITNRMVRAGR